MAIESNKPANGTPHSKPRLLPSIPWEAPVSAANESAGIKEKTTTPAAKSVTLDVIFFSVSKSGKIQLVYYVQNNTRKSLSKSNRCINTKSVLKDCKPRFTIYSEL